MGWLLRQTQSKCILRACCGLFIQPIFPEHPLCVRQSHMAALGGPFPSPSTCGALRTVGPLLSTALISQTKARNTPSGHLGASRLQSPAPVTPLTCQGPWMGHALCDLETIGVAARKS